MGRNREKQRTKGNLKPSSSGRAAASLVTSDGVLGFVGFDGLGSSNLGYVPMTTSHGDEVDGTVDGSFRMVMRKLTKRDALTKYKALQEFSELCKSSKPEVVESILPFWPRLYNKLSMDVDQRVREATQEAMLQVVQRVGRNLAPHLKTLIGAWLCAQFDSYAPVASTAQRAFQAAFSEAKQVEALMFCKVGLCEFLEDNILRQTADTLSDPKVVSKEDRGSKYNRVISSSLLALGYLMTVSSDDVNTEMTLRYQEILEDKKLWKLARHSSPIVRSAIFSLVISCCMKIPSVIQSVSSQVCPVIMSSLDESEPAVCHNLWGAVLFIIKTISDCWSHVNIRKAVLPKLWSVLKHGGYGCASVIYPSLLPFISTLPQEVTCSGVGFYQNFFDSLQEGFQEQRVRSSPSECAVVMATYMECLRYCLVHSSSQENGWSVKGYLVKDQLLPLIKTSLQPDTKIPTMHLYPGVSDLLTFLTSTTVMDTSTKKSVAKDTSSSNTFVMEAAANRHTVQVSKGVPSNSDVAMGTAASRDISVQCKQEAMCGDQLVEEESEVMLDWFWSGFNAICLDVLTSDGQEVDPQLVESLSTCILGLKSPSTHTKKQKRQKVAFANPKTLPLKTEQKSTLSTASIKIEDLYGGQLLETACIICKFCQTEVHNKSSTQLKLFSTLFSQFVSVKLLQVLLEKEADSSQSLNELCEEFLHNTINPWIIEFGEKDKDLSCIMDVLFGVLGCFTLEKQTETLNYIIEVNNSTQFLYNVVQKGITLSLPGMSSWLNSQYGSEKIQKLLRVANMGDSELDEESFWGIMQLVVADSKNGPLVNKSYIDIIMENITQMLRRKDTKHLDEVLALLRGYFEWCSDNPDDLSQCTEDVLLTLFLLQFAQLTIEQERVQDAWQTGLQAISTQYSGCDVILIRMTAIINEQLKSADTLDSVITLSSSAVNLLQTVNKLNAKRSGTSSLYVNKIYHSLLPDSSQCTEWREKSNKGCWLGSNLGATLPVISQIPSTQTVSDTVDLHQRAMVLSILITKAMLSDQTQSLADIIGNEVLVKLYLDTSWINVWCLSVLGCRSVTDTQKVSSYIKQKLPNITKLQDITSTSLQELLHVIKERQILGLLFQEAVSISKTKGWLWSIVLSHLIKLLNEESCELDVCAVLTELYASVFEIESLSLVKSAEDREMVVQSLVAMVPYVESIYDVKVITEHALKYMEKDLTTEEFACVFSSISCALAQWSTLTEGSEEAQIEYQLTLTETLDTIMEWRNKHDRILLLNATMEDVTSAEVSVNVAVMSMIRLIIHDTAKTLNTNHWDFILCGLAGWLQTCEENISLISSSLLTNMLCQQTCKLLAVVTKFFDDFPQHQPSQQQQHHQQQQQHEVQQEEQVQAQQQETDKGASPSSLVDEWTEFFSVNFYNNGISMFLKISALSSENSLSLSFLSTCENLGRALTSTPISIVQSYDFEHAPVVDESLPQWAQDVLHLTLPLLSSNVPPLQITSYHLLSRILGNITSRLKSTELQDTENERSPPSQLMQVIDSHLNHMLSILDDASVPFGTRLCLATDNEALYVSFSLFVSCRLLLVFFQNTNIEARPEYAAHFKKIKLIPDIMSVLFRVIPLDSNTTVTEEFSVSVSDDVTERLAQDLGRSVYYGVLHWMPAMSRQWFNGLEKKYATIVDRYTSSFVSPSLCQREMDQVKTSSPQFPNMQVRARPVAGEVAAVYTVDDLSMELVVKLANNHPLGVVIVDSGKKVGVTTSQWRSWILQMTKFLTHQNGSILDGLLLWKYNADKHFEGVEDCMICFSVIHASNYSLPRQTCRTCKKKFHSVCLYRWFSTSNNSTCPLCRNIF